MLGAQKLVSQENIHDRETEFHDAWAADTPLDAVLVRECFESPTALENRFILALMGNLRGKRVLDIGAGLGESSVYFALQGAEVTTTDISPLMVDKVLQLARNYGVRVTGVVYFDRLHGQTGVAPNGVELHPVLSIEPGP